MNLQGNTIDRIEEEISIQKRCYLKNKKLVLSSTESDEYMHTYQYKNGNSRILQYNESIEDILNLDTSQLGDNDDYHIICNDSINKFIPNTLNGNKLYNNCKLLLVYQRTEPNGEIWRKGAILNTVTHKIALITTTNSETNITKNKNKALKTHDVNWFVGKYGLSAPIVFWRDLQTIIRNN